MQNAQYLEKKNSKTSFNSSSNDSGFIESYVETELLLLTNEQERQSLTELNNRLSKYIEHVRHKDLCSTTVKSIEELSVIPAVQLVNLKHLFENEIKCLRDSLDKQSYEMAKLRLSHDKLVAENKNLDIELHDASGIIDKLSSNLSKSRSDNELLKVKLTVLVDSRNEESDLLYRLNECQNQLENEVLLRTSAENACLTYKEKMEFSEALFKKEFGVLLMSHQNTIKKLTLQNNVFSSDIYQQMEEARNQLTFCLDEYRCVIDNDFLHRIEEASNMIMSSVSRHSDSQQDNGTLANANNELSMELAKLEASHAKLNDQLSKMDLLHQEEIDRLYRTIADISVSQIDDFDERMQSFQELNKSLSKRVQLDSEIIVYRKMIESEEDRTNLNSGQEKSPEIKKRKINHTRSPQKVSSTPKETKTDRTYLRVTRQNKSCNIM